MLRRSSFSLSLASSLTLWLAAQTSVERISVGFMGAQGNLDSAFVSGVSADGRVVAFVSAATNLVAFDTNGVQDIFVRDRTNATTTRVSVSSSGAQADLASGSPSLSLDGRFVAFSSRATNLVLGDTNGVEDIFVHERVSGVTTRVSRDALGIQGNGHSRTPSLSGDGRHIAFASRASNLSPGDTNNAWDVFVHDRVSATSVRVSLDSSGALSDADSLLPSISAGGGCVTFTSFATNLVGIDTNGSPDVFVHDLTTGRTECASVNSAGIPAIFGAQRSFLSADGRSVAFESGSEELVAGDTNTTPDVFVRDRWSGVTTRVSIASSGGESNGLSTAGALSADGRFVTFASLADNLVAFDTNLAQDVFVHDRVDASTRRVSVDAVGLEANAASSAGALSADGRNVVYSSYASNLVAGDSNSTQDVFVFDGPPIVPPPPLNFCTSGTASSGCVANLSANAQPSLSLAHPCMLLATSVEGQKSGLIFYGVDNACFTPNPWGAGSSFLCVKAPLQRTALQGSGGSPGACDGSFALDWNLFQASHPFALGQPWTLGARVFIQAWYRDPPAPKTTGLSNALELIYAP